MMMRVTMLGSHHVTAAHLGDWAVVSDQYPVICQPGDTKLYVSQEHHELYWSRWAENNEYWLLLSSHWSVTSYPAIWLVRDSSISMNFYPRWDRRHCICLLQCHFSEHASVCCCVRNDIIILHIERNVLANVDFKVILFWDFDHLVLLWTDFKCKTILGQNHLKRTNQ